MCCCPAYPFYAINRGRRLHLLRPEAGEVTRRRPAEEEEEECPCRVPWTGPWGKDSEQCGYVETDMDMGGGMVKKWLCFPLPPLSPK